MKLYGVTQSALTISKNEGNAMSKLKKKSDNGQLNLFELLKPDTFFYLDPPYYGCEDYYGDGDIPPGGLHEAQGHPGRNKGGIYPVDQRRK